MVQKIWSFAVHPDGDTDLCRRDDHVLNRVHRVTRLQREIQRCFNCTALHLLFAQLQVKGPRPGNILFQLSVLEVVCGFAGRNLSCFEGLLHCVLTVVTWCPVCAPGQRTDCRTVPVSNDLRKSPLLGLRPAKGDSG
ncbi:hypothetical protein D3C75_827340 [compost metagenome]